LRAVEGKYQPDRQKGGEEEASMLLAEEAETWIFWDSNVLA
jgi:hypothetical protein